MISFFKDKEKNIINNDKSYTSLKEWQNILKNKPKFIVLGIDDSFDYFLKRVNDLDFKKNNYDKIQDVKKIGTYQIIRIF